MDISNATDQRMYALEQQVDNNERASERIRERIQALIKGAEESLASSLEHAPEAWSLVEHMRDELAQINRDHFEPEEEVTR